MKIITNTVNIRKKSKYHVGRHTFATNYLREGGRVEHLMEALGHSNISITMRYVHIVDAEKTEGMKKLSDFYNS